MEQQEHGKAPAPAAAPAQQQEQQAKAQAAARLRALVEQQQAERQRRDEIQLQMREAQTEPLDVEALLAQDRRLAQKEEEERQRRLREEQARLEQQARAERVARAAAALQRKEQLRRCKIACGLLLFFGFDQCLGILLQGAATVFTFLRNSGISAAYPLFSLFGPALLTAGAHLLHKLPEEERFPTLHGLCPWLWTAPLYNTAIGMYLAGTVLRALGSGRFFSSLVGAAVLAVLNFLLTGYLDARLSNWLPPGDSAP